MSNNIIRHYQYGVVNISDCYVSGNYVYIDLIGFIDWTKIIVSVYGISNNFSERDQGSYVNVDNGNIRILSRIIQPRIGYIAQEFY